MSWIRFHSGLMEGAKRALPRATRFIYMELSYYCRGRRGQMILAPGLSDIDAVHDVLGGDRGEVRDAIQRLTSGSDPMIQIESAGEDRVLRICKWEKWNPRDASVASRISSSGEKEREPAFTKTCPRARAISSLSDLSSLSSQKDLSPGGMSTGGMTLRPAPADIPVSARVLADCDMAGAKPPTKADVVACLNNARGRGKQSADWEAELVQWMIRQKRMDAADGMRGKREPEDWVPPLPETKFVEIPPDAVTGEQAAENFRKLKEMLSTMCIPPWEKTPDKPGAN